MNVTWMIGNGFDLGAGLKTRYMDFLSYYLKKKADNAQVNSDKNLIRKEWRKPECNWSDMELKLGDFTTQFPSDTQGLNRFDALMQDLVLELKNSFLKEEAKVQIGPNAAVIRDQLRNALKCPYASLPAINYAAVDKVWNDHRNESVTHHFINFNYTNVLDQCLTCLRNAPNALRHQIGRRVYHDHIGTLVHVHSDLRQTPILGVDHFAQIMNHHFRDEVLARAFVKPMAIIAAGLNTAVRAKRLIQDSQFVITLGMSIGITDSTWWLELANWLRREQDRHLIILDTDPCVNQPYGGCMQRRIAKIRNVLETVIGNDLYWAVRNRIHIASNLIPGTQDRLMKFSLVPEAPPRPSLVSSLKRMLAAITWIQPGPKPEPVDHPDPTNGSATAPPDPSDNPPF